MGLDSVELVIAIEKHFAITIGDGEAEKAMTVQDVADLVARHRTIVPNGRDVRAEVRAQLLAALPAGIGPVMDDRSFAEICSGSSPGAIWERWSSSTTLRLPSLPPKDLGDGKKPLLRFLLKWVPGRSVRDLSFGQVLDAIVAHDHGTLIDPLAPASRYELLMAVIGLSSDKLGISEFEIRPTDSYVDDLGID